MINTTCNLCGGKFDSKTVKVKSHIEHEGIDIDIFDCPICGKETDSLQCN